MAKGITKHPGFNEHLRSENKAAGVHLNPAHKGLLHRDLGVPQGQKIPEAKIKAAEHSSNPAERKRAQFADNFGHKG